MDGIADYIGGALFAFRTARHGLVSNPRDFDSVNCHIFIHVERQHLCQRAHFGFPIGRIVNAGRKISFDPENRSN
jgi:hypothetical protein